MSPTIVPLWDRRVSRVSPVSWGVYWRPDFDTLPVRIAEFQTIPTREDVDRVLAAHIARGDA